ncbi:GL18084 [Drosophila persimilis]|uniref:GL18084 n=1 Tax=Drosophila persimilis TaxID=7234 RepID=B4HC44_DROPE|nr:GL18084 [Drosophila persimilis]
MLGHPLANCATSTNLANCTSPCGSRRGAGNDDYDKDEAVVDDDDDDGDDDDYATRGAGNNRSLLAGK